VPGELLEVLVEKLLAAGKVAPRRRGRQKVL
jgi:hypothetical protein